MASDRGMEPRTAIVAIAVVVAIGIGLAVLLQGGDGDGAGAELPDLPGSDEVADLDEAPGVSDASAEPHPDDPAVPLVDCGGLLSLDAIDDALGVFERDDPPGTLQFEQGETCTYQIFDEADFFVRIEPGEPADFLPEARLELVPGESVDVVADADGANWFDQGDTDGGGFGVLSVRKDTDLGVLLFRVAVGRPDLTATQRLDRAAALAADGLPNFPGVEIAPPEPTVVTFEREPVDRSNLGFAELVLAREEAREWSRAEGLVAVLRVLAGEDDLELMGDPELLSASGTGVIRLAQDQVAAGVDEDADDVAEITRLLDELLLSADELEALTAAAAVEPGAAGAAPEDGSNGDGAGGNEGAAPAGTTLVGFRPSVATPSPAQDDDAPDDDDAADYLLLYENDEARELWSEASGLVEDAVKTALGLYDGYGEMPDIVVVLTDNSGPSEASSTVALPDVDTIFLNPPIAQLDPAQIQQTVAAEMARSLIFETFDAHSVEGLDGYQWWADGLAVYLSGLPFPGANREHDLLTYLNQIENHTTLFDRGPANWVFFEFLHREIGGVNGVFELIGLLPPLSEYPKIAELWHEFNQKLTDGAIDDLGGRRVPYIVPERGLAIADRTVVIDEILPFGVLRLALTVEPGSTSCVNIEQSGVQMSWRAGSVDNTAVWRTDPLTEMIDDVLILVTATEPGARFSMEISPSDDGCPSDDDEDDASISCPDPICGLSEYFHRLADLLAD